MNLERYPYLASNNFNNYEFYSSGPKGQIKKGVRFSLISNDPVIYNLAFGDIPDGTDVIDDAVVSNNNDRGMVLATVANTIIDFTNNYGNHYIFATGSTPARTRLYQMGITSLWNEISIDFDVYGFKGDAWQAFKSNVNYDAFLVKKK
ncbi:DUF6934 family protein [Mucilaginibacter paludis]|uniref:Uncharacterized protein n=1 Tax=Mucilaginibacter paludis DSM 18603 TaxID=714943 RepID=H1Y902_9SPHI|nr:hypothetical protein [Mucilaginibacter paludis]EHQ29040.1 hypothetical protein Mucpa_4958 [Mucilaginibacter paludis DSM 18603]